MSAVRENDIIQITDPENKWFPCLLVVSEVKSWGIQGYITIPNNTEEPNGTAYYRIENGKFEVVGRAVMVTS
jgi:hypothetical protein